MTDIGSIIGAIAAKVGAKLVKGIVEEKIGGGNGKLAGRVIDAIAERVGVPAEELPQAPQKEVETAVREVEVFAPELIAAYTAGIEGQFALLQAETAEGALQSGWRWGWMYLLAVFWTAYVLVFPVLAATGLTIETIDVAILLTLTTWFISLYMGGHTVKALGESAISAVRSWRGR